MKAEAQFAFTELPQAASELARLYENGMIKTNMTDEELNFRVKQLRSINVDREDDPNYNPLLKMLDATAF